MNPFVSSSGSKYDVAVVGAGPAGAWTAHLLASRGARVLLADPSHPREKPCGGGVTSRALSLLGSALAGDQLPAVQIRTARFVETAGAKSATVSLARGAATETLVVASRTDFDGLMVAAARRAGATLLTSRVTGIAREGGRFRLETADGRVERTAWIVGADGASSLVRRTLTSPLRRDQLSIATGFFVRGVSSDEIVLELIADPPGYIWSFPRPDHLAVGICTGADAGSTSWALRARVAEWIRASGIAPNRPLEPYSWPIPSLGARDLETLDAGGDGWLLVGDAAGLVDPITREGIFFALQSGALAADAILSGRADSHRTYLAQVRDEIASELARAARIKAGFFEPRFTHLLIEALGRSEQIRGVMADVIAGAQSYRTLNWRLVQTLEVGLLWRMLRMRMPGPAGRRTSQKPAPDSPQVSNHPASDASAARR